MIVLPLRYLRVASRMIHMCTLACVRIYIYIHHYLWAK